jgi:phenylalanyl-tRNA synthetase beta subunit
VRNALSPDLQYYRTSVMPSLLDKVNMNLRADLIGSDDNDFAIYEIGAAHVKGHVNDEKLPEEMERLALVFASDDKTAARKYEGAALYQAKHYLLPLINYPIDFIPLGTDGEHEQSPYLSGRSAVMKIGEETLGMIGEFKPSVKKAFKLPDFTAGFELDFRVFARHAKPTVYTPISQFPKIQQDITFEVAAGTVFSEVFTLLSTEISAHADEHGYQATVFQPEDSDNKRLTFRVWLSHHNRTLTTAETNRVLDEVAAVLKEKLQAERI